MNGRSWRSTAITVVSVLGLALSLAACLGQDYLDVPLGLSGWNHGWLATIEPDEELHVTLAANGMHPETPWVIVDSDSSVIELVDSFEERRPPEEGQSTLPHWVFIFIGVEIGQGPLVFEARAGERAVDQIEFTVAVVDDACASDMGISAYRCEKPELEGLGAVPAGRKSLEVGAGTSVTLTTNALYPDALWQVAEFDASVVEVESLGQVGPVRTPGDWDLSNETKPGSFLPVSAFALTATGPGETTVAFEIRVDEQRVDLFEFTVTVGDGQDASPASSPEDA